MLSEFIVWDSQKFLTSENTDEFLYIFEKKQLWDLEDINNQKELEFFPYIGKKDINGQKIYADCSIVEFENIGDNMFLKKLKGYFKYCEKHLSFNIVVLDDNLKETTTLIYKYDFIENLKIIDTIQENKLNLIKG